MSDDTERHVFEVDVLVRANGQPDAIVSREYVSREKASTDGAVTEIWEAVSDDIKARMRPVNCRD